MLPGTADFQASLPAKFLAQMLKTALSVKPTEESSAGQAGALLEIAGGVARLVATDGHRLAYFETMLATAGIPGECRSVVPWSTITEVEQVLRHVALDAIVELAWFGLDLHFRVGDRQVRGGSISDRFPNYKPLLHEDRRHSAIVERGKLEGAIKLLLASRGLSETAIRLRLEPGRLRLMAPTAAEPRSFAVEYEGPEVETTLNSRYVVEALGVLGGHKITLRLGNTIGPIEISVNQSADGITQRFIIMPLRI
jgi:DNA polymerase III subunit beta